MLPSPSTTAFDLIRDSDEAKSFRVSFISWPKQWGNCSLPVSLSWTGVKFDPDDSSNVPDDKIGVYAFVAEPRIASLLPCALIFYVGQTGGKQSTKTSRSFRVRYEEYVYEYRGKKKPRLNIVRMLGKWGGHLYFYFAEVPQTEIVKTEDALIKAFMPPANETLPAGVREIIGAF